MRGADRTLMNEIAFFNDRIKCDTPQVQSIVSESMCIAERLQNMYRKTIIQW